jgi:ABC-type branched-subunit amino acid transport system substrate-binding protein
MSGRARIIAERLGVIAIGLLLAASFVGGAAAADLKIGFTFSLTGGTDDYGKAARMGAELALKEYNDKGGYKGQKVEAVIYDDETKPAKGVENVTRLIPATRSSPLSGRSIPASRLQSSTSRRRTRFR